MKSLLPSRPEGIAQREDAAANPWESAYLRFETPEQETRKFLRRLSALGAGRWPRDAEIVELFCGRGNGLTALERLGFSRRVGVDLSLALTARNADRGRVVVADCRRLPYAGRSRDIATVHGGLHHLLRLPADLDDTLSEVGRVLREDGLLLVVEPWDTPFLGWTHAVARNAVARRLSSRLDALATMIEEEGKTYQRWLAAPQQILAALDRHFSPEICRRRWGKLLFVGRRRSA